jgi:hypothetical protein
MCRDDDMAGALQDQIANPSLAIFKIFRVDRGKSAYPAADLPRPGRGRQLTALARTERIRSWKSRARLGSTCSRRTFRKVLFPCRRGRRRTESPSLEAAGATDFFTSAAGNLGRAATAAGVRRSVVLSFVSVERSLDGGESERGQCRVAVDAGCRTCDHLPGGVALAGECPLGCESKARPRREDQRQDRSQKPAHTTQATVATLSGQGQSCTFTSDHPLSVLRCSCKAALNNAETPESSRPLCAACSSQRLSPCRNVCWSSAETTSRVRSTNVPTPA